MGGFRRIALLLVLALGAGATGAGAYDWLQFGGDPQHTGSNVQEQALNEDSVKGLRVLFQVLLPDVADGAAASVEGVQTPRGQKDLLLLTTRDGHVLALDALDGTTVWARQNPAGECRINNGYLPCYTTASPAVDPDRLHVYAYGLDGYAHRYRLSDGQETVGGGWPELTTTKPFNEKGSSDLTIATARSGVTYLYVAHGGYPGDRGDYQGHVTVIDLADGGQRVFNCNCSDQGVHFQQAPATPDCPAVQSAVWARAGVVYDPLLDRIYLATGNGPFAPDRYDWGDSVLALLPDGRGRGGRPLDSYTPADFAYLDRADLDLGSTAPAILPVEQPGGSTHLAVQSGKDGLLRLLDLRNLSGQGGPGHTGGEVGEVMGVPQGGEVLTAPAVWIDPSDRSVWVFIANGRGISGLQLVVNPFAVPRLQTRWQEAAGGTSPLVAGGVLYYAGDRGIRALDPRSGALLWESTQIGRIHWESPIVANGRLYITDEDGRLTAYALPPGR
jgi:outer membrane protein assembly factor BamB